MAAKLVRPSCGKCEQGNVQCDRSRQILQTRMANDGKVEDKKGVFELEEVDEVVLTDITMGEFYLQ